MSAEDNSGDFSLEGESIQEETSPSTNAQETYELYMYELETTNDENNQNPREYDAEGNEGNDGTIANLARQLGVRLDQSNT